VGNKGQLYTLLTLLVRYLSCYNPANNVKRGRGIIPYIEITLCIHLSVRSPYVLKKGQTDTDETLHSCSTQLEDVHEGG